MINPTPETRVLRAQALEVQAMTLLPQGELAAAITQRSRGQVPTHGLRVDCAGELATAGSEAARLLATANEIYWAVVVEFSENARKSTWQLLKRHCKHMEFGDVYHLVLIGIRRGLARWQPDGGKALWWYSEEWARKEVQRSAEFQGTVRVGPQKTWVRRDVSVSTETPVAEGLTVGDTLRADCTSPEKSLATQEEGAIVRDAVSCLTPRLHTVIKMAFWEDAPRTEIAPFVGGVSRERVRQMEARGLAEIKGYIERRKL